MMRLTLCGLVALVVLSGCGPSTQSRRNDAISKFQVGQFEPAKTEFKALTDRNPGDAESYYYLGRIYHCQGQLEFAIFNYQSALTADSSHAEARLWLDRAVKESGSTGTALRFLPQPPTQQ